MYWRFQVTLCLGKSEYVTHATTLSAQAMYGQLLIQTIIVHGLKNQQQ